VCGIKIEDGLTFKRNIETVSSGNQIEITFKNVHSIFIVDLSLFVLTSIPELFTGLLEYVLESHVGKLFDFKFFWMFEFASIHPYSDVFFLLKCFHFISREYILD